jgi:hypothetical protein
MDGIRIDTGTKRITVNGDESRIIEFNPDDIVFVERFYGLIKRFEEKEKEIRTRSDEVVSIVGEDEHGIPKNTAASLELVLDLCKYLRKEIDSVFGVGTSQAAFGETQTLNMFEQFFTGITPFVQQARSAKVDKYRKKHVVK